MSIKKTLIASVLAFSSVSVAYAGGLDEAIEDDEPVYLETDAPKFGGMGAGLLLIPLVVLLAASDSSDGTSDTTSNQ